MFFIQTEGRDRIGSRGRSAPIAQALADGVYGGGRAHGGRSIVWPVDRVAGRSRNDRRPRTDPRRSLRATRCDPGYRFSHASTRLAARGPCTLEDQQNAQVSGNVIKNATPPRCPSHTRLASLEVWMFFIQTEGRDRIGSRGRSAPIAQALAHGVYGGGRSRGGGRSCGGSIVQWAPPKNRPPPEPTRYALRPRLPILSRLYEACRARAMHIRRSAKRTGFGQYDQKRDAPAMPLTHTSRKPYRPLPHPPRSTPGAAPRSPTTEPAHPETKSQSPYTPELNCFTLTVV